MDNESKSLITALIKDAIQLEIDGEKYYRKSAIETTDKNSKKLFNILADDEKNHKEILNKKSTILIEMDDIAIDNNFSVDASQFKKTFTKNRLKIFANEVEVLKKDLNRDKSNLVILKEAIKKEESSINLYSLPVKKIPSENIKSFLRHMVNVEKEHKEILSDYLAFLEEPEGGWDRMERWACQT